MLWHLAENIFRLLSGRPMLSVLEVAKEIPTDLPVSIQDDREIALHGLQRAGGILLDEGGTLRIRVLEREVLLLKRDEQKIQAFPGAGYSLSAEKSILKPGMRLYFGRSQDNDVKSQDVAGSVSRYHFSVEMDSRGRITVRNLLAKNKTAITVHGSEAPAGYVFSQIDPREGIGSESVALGQLTRERLSGEAIEGLITAGLDKLKMYHNARLPAGPDRDRLIYLLRFLPQFNEQRRAGQFAKFGEDARDYLHNGLLEAQRIAGPKEYAQSRPFPAFVALGGGVRRTGLRMSSKIVNANWIETELPNFPSVAIRWAPSGRLLTLSIEHKDANDIRPLPLQAEREIALPGLVDSYGKIDLSGVQAVGVEFVPLIHTFYITLLDADGKLLQAYSILLNASGNLESIVPLSTENGAVALSRLRAEHNEFVKPLEGDEPAEAVRDIAIPSEGGFVLDPGFLSINDLVLRGNDAVAATGLLSTRLVTEERARAGKEANEDRVGILDNDAMVLTDGQSIPLGGSRASAAASAVILSRVGAALHFGDRKQIRTLGDAVLLGANAFEMGNAAVAGVRAQKNENGIATTAVLVLPLQVRGKNGDVAKKALVFNMGDSRAILVKKSGEARQLTVDGNMYGLMQHLGYNGNPELKHRLVESLGHQFAWSGHNIRIVDLEDGDRLLVASDGVNVSPEEMERIISNNPDANVHVPAILELSQTRGLARNAGDKQWSTDDMSLGSMEVTPDFGRNLIVTNDSRATLSFPKPILHTRAVAGRVAATVFTLPVRMTIGLNGHAIDVSADGDELRVRRSDTGQTLSLSAKDTLTVGREPGNRIQFDHETVSGRHLRIVMPDETNGVVPTLREISTNASQIEGTELSSDLMLVGVRRPRAPFWMGGLLPLSQLAENESAFSWAQVGWNVLLISAVAAAVIAIVKIVSLVRQHVADRRNAVVQPEPPISQQEQAILALLSAHRPDQALSRVDKEKLAALLSVKATGLGMANAVNARAAHSLYDPMQPVTSSQLLDVLSALATLKRSRARVAAQSKLDGDAVSAAGADPMVFVRVSDAKTNQDLFREVHFNLTNRQRQNDVIVIVVDASFNEGLLDAYRASYAEMGVHFRKNDETLDFSAKGIAEMAEFDGKPGRISVTVSRQAHLAASAVEQLRRLKTETPDRISFYLLLDELTRLALPIDIDELEHFATLQRLISTQA
jgi:serine/threonine protein phosphatase PrpC